MKRRVHFLLAVFAIITIVFGCVKVNNPNLEKESIASKVPLEDGGNIYISTDTLRFSDEQLKNPSVFYEAHKYYLQLAQKNYDEKDYIIRNLSSPYCFALFDKSTSICSKIIFFDKENNNILNEVDVQRLNPYLKYLPENKKQGTIIQQLIGFNYPLKEGTTKNNVSDIIPPVLYKSLPDSYNLYSLHINTYIKQEKNEVAISKEPIILTFGYNILPPEEILEHIVYPGISSFVILDGETGKIISRNFDLPFVMSDVTVTNDERYLLVTHLPQINNQEIYNNSEYWKQCVSIYKLNNNSPCFHDCFWDEYYTGKDSKTGLAYFHYSSEGQGKGNIVESILFDSIIHSFTYRQGTFKRTLLGVNVNGDFFSFQDDFIKTPLSCK